MKSIDIIMPTYNRAPIMSRAIESVLAQTHREWRLIIVDDGSTDATAKTVKTYSDSRISYVTATHSGVSKARNIGLSHGSNPLVAYLDTDNLWFPYFLERMTQALPSHKVFAYSAQNMLLMEGSHIRARKIRNEPFNLPRLLASNFIDINSVIHRRSLIEEVGAFDEELTSVEDWDLFVRFAQAHPFGFEQVEEVLGEYRYSLSSDLETVTNATHESNVLETFSILPNPDKNDLRVQAKIDAWLKEL